MSGGLLAVAAAVVTGILALFGALLAGSQRAKAFVDEWARSREDRVANSAVRLIQTIATNLARAAHIMWWLTWRAANDWERLSDEALGKYEWEFHELLPQIVGAQAALRAMDPNAADEVDPAVARLNQLCADISLAIVQMRAGDHAPLAQKLADAIAYQGELATAMKGAAGRILATYGRTPRLAPSGTGARSR